LFPEEFNLWAGLSSVEKERFTQASRPQQEAAASAAASAASAAGGALAASAAKIAANLADKKRAEAALAAKFAANLAAKKEAEAALAAKVANAAAAGRLAANIAAKKAAKTAEAGRLLEQKKAKRRVEHAQKLLAKSDPRAAATAQQPPAGFERYSVQFHTHSLGLNLVGTRKDEVNNLEFFPTVSSSTSTASVTVAATRNSGQISTSTFGDGGRQAETSAEDEEGGVVPTATATTPPTPPVIVVGDRLESIAGISVLKVR